MVRNITVIYGAGEIGRKCLHYIGNVDYFCDEKANEIISISGIPCILPKDLKELDGEIVMYIAISNKGIREEIKEKIESTHLNIEVKDFVENLIDADDYLYRCTTERKKLNIHIVYSEDGWIFGKFASKLKEEIRKAGYECSVSHEEDPKADINHYISYGMLSQIYLYSETVKTTMITHIDTEEKRNLIRSQAKAGITGICMSKDTMEKLERWGVSSEHLCYVNPAHDSDLPVKKIKLGITNRCYSNEIDFRKNDASILQIMKDLDREYFSLWIMGSGWDDIVLELRNMGIDVDYDDDFDREIYKRKMSEIDYWMYYGFDEGAMGFLDALSAGVKVIATPQGYHLDAIAGLTYACSTIGEFQATLQQIQEQRMKIVNSVKDWTWDNYARKHIEIWRYLTRSITLKELHQNQGVYQDGIFSLLLQNNTVVN